MKNLSMRKKVLKIVISGVLVVTPVAIPKTVYGKEKNHGLILAPIKEQGLTVGTPLAEVHKRVIEKIKTQQKITNLKLENSRIKIKSSQLRKHNNDLQQKNKELKKEISILKKKKANRIINKNKVTQKNPVGKNNDNFANNGIATFYFTGDGFTPSFTTASGEDVSNGRVNISSGERIVASNAYPLHTKLRITLSNGNSIIASVEDTGHLASNQVDILVKNEAEGMSLVGGKVSCKIEKIN